MSRAAGSTALRSQYQAIDGRLDAAGADAEREAVKREIIALFKQVDGALSELTQLKEDIRGLVERYKQAGAARRPTPAPAPQFTGARPAVHADHLGASTFIEKGWSLISLGDYAGAIQSLEQGAPAFARRTSRRSRCSGWAQMLHEDYDDALATFSKVLMKEPANSLARINVGYICLKKRIFGEAIEHLSKAIRLDNDRKATLYAHYYLGLVYLEREMYEDAQTFFQKTLQARPQPDRGLLRAGPRALVRGRAGRRASGAWEEGHKANKFNPWGKRCKEMLDLVAAGGEPPRTSCLLIYLLVQRSPGPLRRSVRSGGSRGRLARADRRSPSAWRGRPTGRPTGPASARRAGPLPPHRRA